MADNEKKILDAIKKAVQPVKSGDIAKLTGIDSKIVGAVIKKLKEDGKIVSPKRCFYSINK